MRTKTIMQNYKVLIKPEETQSDIVAEICDDLAIGSDEPFAFSAIEVVTTAKGRSQVESTSTKDEHTIKINCLVPARNNPYTPTTLISKLFSAKPKKGVRYVQPPIDQWLRLYQPLLYQLVHKAYPFYQKLFTQKELLSTLYFVITKLYKADYYLHKSLIYRSFVNELNMEVRKLKHHQDDVSIYTEVGGDNTSSDNAPVTIGDILIDQNATDMAHELTHYSLKDYWEDMFNAVKECMLQDMSQLSFDRILLQLSTKTVDNQTSHRLMKYRKMFNSSQLQHQLQQTTNKTDKRR